LAPGFGRHRLDAGVSAAVVLGAPVEVDAGAASMTHR